MNTEQSNVLSQKKTSSFGSKVRGRRTGIMFNDEMDDFSTPGTSNSFGVPASPANYIEPGKRPMSSMAPTIIFNQNGDPVFLSGAAGGTRITTAIPFVCYTDLTCKMNFPRVFPKGVDA